jgi:oligopeptide/dipeptide ABC transporter ATP-binding protein
MYAGKIVESSAVEVIFANPLHPYTRGLLESIPARCVTSAQREDHLKTIPGSVPSLYDLAPGCRFQDRCPYAEEVCSQIEPPLLEIETGHLVACWKYSPQNNNQIRE